ncbi:hypothetical protein GF385_03880 [Candidatus Dependentiae bacterium]|nr:hypothetical protein [Candidatus Dependentiae bacterium]
MKKFLFLLVLAAISTSVFATENKEKKEEETVKTEEVVETEIVETEVVENILDK